MKTEEKYIKDLHQEHLEFISSLNFYKDELVSKINCYEHELVENVKANNVATDHRKVTDHVDIRTEFNTFEKIYNELKVDFQTFLSKYF